jgi:hypothetical protein
MAAWYAKWYPNPGHQRAMASFVMGLMLFLNLMSLVGVLAVLGWPAAFRVFFAYPIMGACAFGTSILLHFGLGRTKSGGDEHREGAPIPTRWNRRVAAVYILVCAAAFLGTMTLVGLRYPSGVF